MNLNCLGMMRKQWTQCHKNIPQQNQAQAVLGEAESLFRE